MKELNELIYETDFWKIFLLGDQYYLGRCVIILKRKEGNLSNLTSEEWMDFHKNVVKKLEKALKKAFKATMFNWTCLMNNAYKSKNPKPLVHWHFRPRYNHKVKFGGDTYEDHIFAHHYSRSRKNLLPKEKLIPLVKEIKKYL